MGFFGSFICEFLLFPVWGWAFPGVLRGGFVCSLCIFRISLLVYIVRVVGFFVFCCVVCFFCNVLPVVSFRVF